MTDLAPDPRRPHSALGVRPGHRVNLGGMTRAAGSLTARRRVRRCRSRSSQPPGEPGAALSLSHVGRRKTGEKGECKSPVDGGLRSTRYTVDVPLPFIDFGHSKWVAVGVAQTVTVVLVLLGWVLAPRGDCRVRRRTAPWGPELGQISAHMMGVASAPQRAPSGRFRLRTGRCERLIGVSA